VEDNIDNNQPWGRKGTLPYTLGKVQAEPNVNPNDQCFFFLPELGCLATYVGYVSYVSVSLG